MRKMYRDNKELTALHTNTILYLLIPINFRYITSIEENAKEGTKLVFEGGLDKVEDLDKVRECACQLVHNICSNNIPISLGLYFVGCQLSLSEPMLLFLRHSCDYDRNYGP